MTGRLTEKYVLRGEKFHALTHLAGAVLALIGTFVLIVLAALGGDPWKVVSVSIFGVTGDATTTSPRSTTTCAGAQEYPAQAGSPQHLFAHRRQLHPFCTVTLRGPWGWSLLGVVWGLAALGSLQELGSGEARKLSLAIYVMMGWVALLVMFQLLTGAGATRVRGSWLADFFIR